MKAHYGYADGSGDYFITVDTDKCDGCGDCVTACPKSIFEVIEDDYDELKAVVKPEFSKTLADHCPGYETCCREENPNCHSVCKPDAITHSW